MVNNINGLTSTHSSTSRNQEKAQAAGKPDQASVPAKAHVESESSAKVSLSAEAKQLQDIEVSLKHFPEVNQERVNQLRDTLREGNYNVDPARLAAKIVQFELDI
ncbi:MAG: negative regulator of flagellin synthesis FlgM [Candidatus Azotimanducaceae bacterium]|jgi:negative regulator of flagellin synthesis FlgM